MITVKNLIRTACVLLLSVLLLNSCVSKKVEDFPFVPLDTVDLSDKISEYRIIISDTASNELTGAAETLRDRLQEKTSVPVTVLLDSDELVYKTAVWNIYVGNTCSNASQQALRDMRVNDYTCRSFDGYSVIGGRSDGASIAAIERYISELLPLADHFQFIPEGGGFDFVGDYAVSEVTLLGLDISQFEISYDENSPLSANIAHTLRDSIAERTGYYLGTVSGDGTKPYISLRIGNGYGEGKAYIFSSADGIQIQAHSATGLRVAAEKLLDIICPEGSFGALSPTVPTELSISYSEPICRLASLSLYGLLPIDAASEITDICSAVKGSDPELFLCGNIGKDDRKRIDDNLSDYRELGNADSSAVFGSSEASAALGDKLKVVGKG